MMAERTDTFTFDRAGNLVRSVIPRTGKPYEHRCTRQAFETVAHASGELTEQGFTLEEIAQREDLPFTQVAVALAFLKERGCVETEGRRSYPVSSDLYIDAMIEWHALREQGIKASG